MNKDTIIGIVGAVVLVAAMVGVFQYEGSQSASTLGGAQFQVTWATDSANGPTVSGSTAVGEETEEVLTVEETNLTRSEFTLVWTPGPGSTNTMRLTVTPPAGTGLDAQTVEGTGGEISLSFDVPNDVPQDATVFGNSEEEARGRLAAQYTKSVGTGDWGVTVAFDSAEGPVPGVPVGGDSEVAWDVNTILTRYAPSLDQS